MSLCKDPTISVFENGKSLHVKNKAREEIQKERVQTDDKNLRCDYRLRLAGKWDIFAELKGKKSAHALEQILETAAYKNTQKDNEDRIGVIVCSKVPKTDTEYTNVRLKYRGKIQKLGFREILRKNIKLTLEFKSGKLTET